MIACEVSPDMARFVIGVPLSAWDVLDNSERRILSLPVMKQSDDRRNSYLYRDGLSTTHLAFGEQDQEDSMSASL